MASDIPPDLSDAFAGWLHDVRNPLTQIAGYSDLLDTGMLGELTEIQRDAAHAMRLAAHRVLIRLELSSLYLQLRTEQFTLDWEPRMLDDVIVAAMARIRPPLPAHAVQLDLVPPLPAIRATAALVYAFSAFIDPYLTHRDATPPVTIHAQQQGETVVVDIRGQYTNIYYHESPLWPGSPLDTAQQVLTAYGSPVHITTLDQPLVRFAFALPVADAPDTRLE